MYRRRVALVALLCFEVPRHKGGGTIGHHTKKNMKGLSGLPKCWAPLKKKKHGSV